MSDLGDRLRHLRRGSDGREGDEEEEGDDLRLWLSCDLEG